MTEEKQRQIEATAQGIIDAATELQDIAISHHAIQSQGAREMVYSRLKSVKDMAARLSGGNDRLDKLFGIRSNMANSMNSMAHMLGRDRLRGGIENVSDSELENMLHVAETLAARINVYLAERGRNDFTV